MKKSIAFASVIALLAAGCSQQPSGEVDVLKADLEAKKGELKALEDEIKDIEAAIIAIDPDYKAFERNAKLVTTLPVEQGLFEHFVEVRGNVVSRTNVTLSAEAGGTIQRIPVREGQYVKKGQTLISVDAAILRSNIAELEKSLELSRVLFEKQERLWNDNVGTEVQFLQAKNQVESLEKRIEATKAQLALSNTTAPFSGRVDQLMVNVGQQVAPGMPMLRIVGDTDMYLEADLSETYIGAFKKDDVVGVTFPSISKEESASKVTAVGEVINPLNRTITVEMAIPASVTGVKPNMLSVVKLNDFSKEDALIVPTNLIQKDGRGDFIFVVRSEGGDTVAKKIRVTRGMNYRGTSFVESDELQAGDKLIDAGFREVVDGAYVKETTEG